MCRFSLAGEGLGNHSLKQITNSRESGEKPQHTGVIHSSKGIAPVFLLLICFKETWGECRGKDFFKKHQTLISWGKKGRRVRERKKGEKKNYPNGKLRFDDKTKKSPMVTTYTQMEMGKLEV